MYDLKRTLTSITKNVAKTSNGLIKTAKVNMTLINEEENLKSIYLEIGQKVHEIYSYGGTLGKFFDGKYLEILELERKIQELRKQIELTKPEKEIGKPVGYEPVGYEPVGYAPTPAPETPPVPESIPEPVTALPPEPPEPVASEQKPVANKKECPSCGAQNDSGERFCLSCGRII